MKKIEALVRPERLNDVRRSLAEMGHRTMINFDIWYRGNENEIDQHSHDGNSRLYDFMSKIKVELIVRDDEVETIMNTICENAHTGHVGDGKIFVLPVEMAVRIQTKETGDAVF
jgi:nitrogen regulatory protein P-II 1